MEKKLADILYKYREGHLNKLEALQQLNKYINLLDAEKYLEEYSHDDDDE